MSGMILHFRTLCDVNMGGYTNMMKKNDAYDPTSIITFTSDSSDSGHQTGFLMTITGKCRPISFQSCKFFSFSSSTKELLMMYNVTRRLLGQKDLTKALHHKERGDSMYEWNRPIEEKYNVYSVQYSSPVVSKENSITVSVVISWIHKWPLCWSSDTNCFMWRLPS